MSTLLPTELPPPYERSEKGRTSNAASVDEKGTAPPLGVPVQASGSFWRRTRVDIDAIATQPSVFDEPATLAAYHPPPQYENSHRFDPNARWTWREEKVRVHRGAELNDSKP